MALLDGFKVIPLKEKIDDTYLTISEKSLKLNRATAVALGMPGYVKFMLNEKRMQIAITPTKAEDEDAVSLTVEEGKREKPIYVRDFSIVMVVTVPSFFRIDF